MSLGGNNRAVKRVSQIVASLLQVLVVVWHTIVAEYIDVKKHVVGLSVGDVGMYRAIYHAVDCVVWHVCVLEISGEHVVKRCEYSLV
jgi:hypothetical protein